MSIKVLAKTSAKLPVWVDYDVAFGKVIRDVDDGYALITAIQSPKLDIKGISYGFGNLKKIGFMKKATYKILKKTKRLDIPVFAGATQRDSEFPATKATHALAKALIKDKLYIMAMGRLSNVASLIKHYPELKERIHEVIINAGRRLETETKVGKKQVIMPDTNIDDDLEAMRFVLSSGVKIVMIPTEIMKDKFVTKKHLRKMRKAGGISKWMAKKAAIWRFIWKLYPNTPGFIPWDVFIVTYLTHQKEFICDDNIPAKLEMLKNNTSSLFRKKYRRKYKEFLVSSYSLSSPYFAKYCYKMENDHLDNIINRWTHF